VAVVPPPERSRIAIVRRAPRRTRARWPAKEYREDHLPGAINLPLRQLETEARRVLDVSRPVMVYCWDTA